MDWENAWAAMQHFVSHDDTKIYRMIICGIIGSISIEVASIVNAHQKPGKLPTRYSRTGFWIWRCILALFSGFLVAIYGIQNAALAFHLGIATPVLLEQLSKKPPKGLVPDED